MVDPVEPLAVEVAGDREMNDCRDTVREEAKISVSADPATSKPVVSFSTLPSLTFASVTVCRHDLLHCLAAQHTDGIVRAQLIKQTKTHTQNKNRRSKQNT